MDESQLSTKEEYLQLLDLTYEVVQSLKGKVVKDYRWTDCQQLATKIFFHATTVYWLREEGTKAPVPYSAQGTSFYDFASSAVLTRVTLETYLVMYGVFFEPETEDEFEFNHAYWLLSGFILREGYDPLDPNLKRKMADAQIEIQDMKRRIQNTNKFKTLKSGEQKNVLRGRWKRSWKNLAKAAGFGEETIQRLQKYLSGFVHADGLSGTQIMCNSQDKI